MTRQLAVVMTLLACLLLGTTRASAEFIMNGSFEVGPFPGLELNLPVGSTAISGWTVVNNPIDYVGTRWPASDGNRSIDLNGSSVPLPGGIDQVFSTTPGLEYLVQFDMAGNPGFGAGSGIKTMRVSAAGQSADFSFDTTGHTLADIGWVSRSWSFTASSTSTSLVFSSLTTGTFFGPALDNVQVSQISAVPEPATLVMLGTGAVTLFAYGCRRRRVAAPNPALQM